MKAIHRADHTQMMIDCLGGRRGIFVELIANVIEQSRFIDVENSRGRMLLMPAREVQEIIGIGAQGTERKLANTLGIEEAIGPRDFLPLGIDQTIGGMAGDPQEQKITWANRDRKS